jgi:NADH:ubiquinone oxidoreductase 24 kD subunit
MQISICIGSACHLKGSYNIITDMQELIEERSLGDQIELKAVFCLGNCQKGVSVQIDENPQIYSVTPKTTKEFFQDTVLPLLKA